VISCRVFLVFAKKKKKNTYIPEKGPWFREREAAVCVCMYNYVHRANGCREGLIVISEQGIWKKKKKK
jgi:hypothetical protein